VGNCKTSFALLSGRNFETKQNEEAIVEESFGRLGAGVTEFMNETNFRQFVLIIRSTGFVDPSMYYFPDGPGLRIRPVPDTARPEDAHGDIQHWVARWFVMSVLTGRYSGSSESAIDEDIRQIQAHGIEEFASTVMRGELSDAFWDTMLPQQMDTSSRSSPAFCVFEAAQVKLNDLGFLSHDFTVKDLIEVKSDIHHFWPRDFLKKNGLSRSQYNQIANYVLAQSEINIAIGNKEPGAYMGQMLEQCHGGPSGMATSTTRKRCEPT